MRELYAVERLLRWIRNASVHGEASYDWKCLPERLYKCSYLADHSTPVWNGTLLFPAAFEWVYSNSRFSRRAGVDLWVGLPKQREFIMPIECCFSAGKIPYPNATRRKFSIYKLIRPYLLDNISTRRIYAVQHAYAERRKLRYVRQLRKLQMGIRCK